MTMSKGAGALDIGTATLAAASAGFLLFAMPDTVFSGLVSASRLPDFVAAAQPPLGQTARIATVSAGAIFTFLAIFSLMRALDRIGARPRPTIIEVPEEEEAPRLRRADIHPDAPARRPLLARQELGEPEEANVAQTAKQAEAASADLDPRPLPGFLAPTQAETEEREPEVGEAAAEPELGTLELDQEASLDTLGGRLPEAADADGEESVVDLMQRLESGLGRRQKPQALVRAETQASEAPPAGAAEDRVGHRLRSAINDLQDMAARGG